MSIKPIQKKYSTFTLLILNWAEGGPHAQNERVGTLSLILSAWAPL